MPLSLYLNEQWLAGRLMKEGKPVLWHDSTGYCLFMEDTVFIIKPEVVCQVGPGHTKL